MNVISDVSSIPDGGWQYPHPVSGMISCFNYQVFYPRILEAYQSNKVVPPSEQTVIDYVCANAWVPCFESETHTPLINKFTLGLPRPPTSGCCGGNKMLVPTRGESL